METYFPIFPFLPACEQVSEYRIAHKSKGCADAVQIDFPIYIYVYISIFWKRDETFQAWYRSSRCLLSMFLESLLKCCCSTTTFSVIQHPKSPDYGVVWDRSFHGAVPASSALLAKPCTPRRIAFPGQGTPMPSQSSSDCPDGNTSVPFNSDNFPAPPVLPGDNSGHS